MDTKLRTQKGVSPVIATVILVAVAITVAVAVAYWMSGISGQYTQFEKVELSTVQTTVDADSNWVIAIDLRNTGTSTATIDSIYVNDAICTAESTGPVIDGTPETTIETDLTTTIPWQLTSGDDGTLTVWIGGNYLTLSPGTTVNIKIHSAAGMDYFKLVKLP